MPVGYDVGSDVRQWNEDSPFHQEDAEGDEGKGKVFENGEIRGDASETGDLLAWQPASDKQICNNKEENQYKSQDTGSPGETYQGEEFLKHERKDDTSDGARGHGNSGCVAALHKEEVSDGGNAWGIDETPSNSVENTIDQKEVPIFLTVVSRRSCVKGCDHLRVQSPKRNMEAISRILPQKIKALGP